MLTQIRLSNVRRFDDYTVPLKGTSVVVGPNNAGKSTIVEAVRLISLVANRLKGLSYGPVPHWLTSPVGSHGVRPTLRDLLATTPFVDIEGWTGWQRVVGAAAALRNASGDSVASFAIFDSDYHDPSEVIQRYDEARVSGIRLHVWSRKEAENFLLVPSAIGRYIASQAKGPGPSEADVAAQLEIVIASLETEATDDCATRHQARQRGLTAGSSNKWARGYAASRTSEPDGSVSFTPAKKALQAMSAWSKGEYGVTFGAAAIAREMHRSELAAEVVEVLRAIRDNRSLPEPASWTSRA